MSSEPKSFTGKLVYNLYKSDVRDAWVIESPQRDRPTAIEQEWQDIKDRANQLLRPSGSAYVMFQWGRTQRNDWTVKRVYVNRAFRLDGPTVAATTRLVN